MFARKRQSASNERGTGGTARALCMVRCRGVEACARLLVLSGIGGTLGGRAKCLHSAIIRRHFLVDSHWSGATGTPRCWSRLGRRGVHSSSFAKGPPKPAWIKILVSLIIGPEGGIIGAVIAAANQTKLARESLRARAQSALWTFQ